ncbi:hypothetical protein F0170_11175 [Pseudomonas sp. MAFF 730085]|uniref:Uncharacterized protein n=1 Tax=Pseudomonas kitaguniensis TaxID=2607908 RepID=A0A5N7JSY0_9PSED|nr:hypothetical protein [Pseudomonas kitaguniensis]MPQ84499.1 hypothetical protein [Pseudomonas kitaguniensis]
MSEHNNYSDQIQKMSPKKGDLLVVTSPHHLTLEQRKRMADSLTPFADRLGVQVLALEGGATAQLQPNIQGLLDEQKKQTALLEQIAKQQILMIEVLADEQDEQDPDAPPMTYMDGRKVT